MQLATGSQPTIAAARLVPTKQAHRRKKLHKASTVKIGLLKPLQIAKSHKATHIENSYLLLLTLIVQTS